jgi:hypothetical protein
MPARSVPVGANSLRSESGTRGGFIAHDASIAAAMMEEKALHGDPRRSDPKFISFSWKRGNATY